MKYYCKDCQTHILGDSSRCEECTYSKYYALHREYSDKVHNRLRNNRRARVDEMQENIRKMKKKCKEVGVRVSDISSSESDDPDWTGMYSYIMYFFQRTNIKLCISCFVS